MGRMKIVVLLMFCFISACALPVEQNVGKYNNNYEALFQAAAKAAQDIDFSIIRNDIDAGIIIAEKTVENAEKGTITRQLNISVVSTTEGTRVEIVFVDDDKKTINGYKRALKKRAPSYLYVMN